MSSKPEQPPEPRGSTSQYWQNLVQPMPLRRKLRLFYQNLFQERLRTRANCCNHPGQPGC
ncbi:MAG TPA: hypothetical protein VKY74_13710 [Chloroflexia bacterium]|nr:hypothetical protein [Chloroflexia bacterium]